MVQHWHTAAVTALEAHLKDARHYHASTDRPDKFAYELAQVILAREGVD
jgi:hypothetical protein